MRCERRKRFNKRPRAFEVVALLPAMFPSSLEPANQRDVAISYGGDLATQRNKFVPMACDRRVVKN